MLQNYFPVYRTALHLQALRSIVELRGSGNVYSGDAEAFHGILVNLLSDCLKYDLTNTADMAQRLLAKGPHKTYNFMLADLEHLDGSLSNELMKQAVFRIPPDRMDFYELDDLFGPEVSKAFPTCERDIRKAGSCYALGQEDACVHHLMLVLERGLTALAAKVGVSDPRANWQMMINQITGQLKTAPPGPDRDFYREVNAQFGFLKDAYRDHSEHAHDDPYDLDKALSIFKHVRAFMQALAKGGLSE